ncbi:hypothetical protein Btru_017597 [Bulinus truncatus]|nr:hypothetical protein Btru_017597 [Bulinus truncatus]
MKLILLLWIPMTHFLIIGKCSLEVGLKARRVLDSLGSKLLLEISCKLQQTPSDKECDYVLFCYIIKNERQNAWGTLAQLCQSYDVDVKDPIVIHAKGVISEAENVSQSHLTLTLPYYAPYFIRKLKCLATFACTDSLEEPRVLSAVISNEADKDIYRYLEDRERPVKDEPMKDTGITTLLLYLNKLLERFVTVQANETMAQTQRVEEVIKSNKKFIQELNTQLASRIQHVNKTLNAEISSRRQDIQNWKFTIHILSHYYGQLEGNFEIFSQEMRDSLSGINATLHQIIKTGNEVKNALKQLEDENQLQGSYCINREGNCPVRFSSGYLYFDEENDNFSAAVAGEGTDNTSSDLLYFCCRSDRSPDIPIALPRHSPFYLYRYGGACQRVEGMSYTEEYVYFDTEDTGNQDAAYPPVPDGKINGINITLCYYDEKEYRK